MVSGDSTAKNGFPDHTQLPESDSTPVLAKRTVGQNWQEHFQGILLTESIKPILQKYHPDGQYCIGQDLGIYWKMTYTPECGAEFPKWFYVPNVPPIVNGEIRHSYVLWQEFIAPLIVLEFVSGNGDKERDKTRWKGKFWIYEQVIHPAFYCIYGVNKASIEVYHFIEGQYQLLAANERGHYPIAVLGIELGIWQGKYQNLELPWLRFWDSQGNLLLTGEERAELERQKNDRLIAQLKSLGIEPEV